MQLSIQCRAASTLSAEEAVLVPIHKLFEGIAKGDKTAILEQLLPDGGATVIRDGKIIQFCLGALVDRLPPATVSVEERIHDPLIRIDNDIAIVWAPYEVLIDGKVDHCGTDVLNLVFHDERWVIAGIADNSRRLCKPTH